ncbi:3'-5' exonuclease, partial [Paratractidigestivibacter sp.]|uniref:3'-5' exonuclease n=1 Tax=Paratractidigestivibacter sp. TaxID=2847316 RepID=UPI0040283628
MELSQAIDLASAFVLPGLVSDEASLQAERMKNEDAIKTLMDAWKSAPAGKEPFGFDLVLSLVDRNRGVCDRIGAEKLRDTSPSALARKLPDSDLVHAVAAMQHRPDAEVAAQAGPALEDLNIAYVDAPVSGMVMGIDIETTDRDPARGYVVNIGLEFMDLAAKAKPHDAFAGYCGIPAMYAEKGVPLEFIHHITWDDVKDVKPLRANAPMQ